MDDVRDGRLAQPGGRSVVGFIDRLKPDLVAGWMHDEGTPFEPVHFLILVDDIHRQDIIASMFRADVIAGGYPTPHVGFTINIPSRFQDHRPHSIAFYHDDGAELLLCDPATRIWSHRWIIGAEAVGTLTVQSANAETSIIVTVDKLADGVLAGWAYDEADVAASAALALVIDGEEVERFAADELRRDVRNSGHPQAQVGYTRRIPSRYCDDRSHVLSLHGLDGQTIRSAVGAPAPTWNFRFASTSIVGQVDGLKDGAIRGWVLHHDHLAARRSGGLSVLITHRGQPVGQIVANQFRADVAEAHDCDPNCGFSFVPAIELVAGRSIDLRFRVLPDGPELQGSPYAAHFPAMDAYREVRNMLGVADQLFTQMWALRAQLKAMLPAEQHNLACYDAWARRYRKSLCARPAASLVSRPLVSIICPTFRPRLADFRAAVQSILDQSYQNWELIVVDDCSQRTELEAVIEEFAAADGRIRPYPLLKNAGISGATNRAIEQALGAFIAFFDHDDLLAPRAIDFMLEAAQRTDAKVLYCDEDKIDDLGVYSEPNLKPDWNDRFLLSQNYVCHLLFVEACQLRAAGPLRTCCDGAQDHDLILRLSEITSPTQIHHVQDILYHWRKTPTSTAASGKSKSYAVQAGVNAVSDALTRREMRGTVRSPLDATFYAIEWSLPAAPPRVTIIIPYREHIELTRACVEAVRAITAYPNFEIILVDNWSITAEAATFADEMTALSDVRAIRVERSFNYSELNNIAVAASEGAFLLFLNNDVFVRDRNWLTQMVGEAMSDARVAIVGVKLLYPNRIVQHAGVVLGVGGVADHAHRGLSADDPGYMARAICAQNLSAVTAACMLCRRDAFDAVHGFDAVNLRVAFNDVDLCLRVSAAGYRIVWTPEVSAEHRESLSRGSDFKPEHQARFFDENQYMESRWSDALAQDPHYSRFFSRRSGMLSDLVAP